MKTPAAFQLDLLDLLTDAAPPADAAERTPPSAEVFAFPLARHVTARTMAARMARTPPAHRDRVWRAHTRRLMRDRIAAGLTPAAARADLLDYTRRVRCLTEYLACDGQRSGS